jgi:hypothetical protein
MYLTKEKLQDAEIDNEIIRKFAELHPDGIEVRSDLFLSIFDNRWIRDIRTLERAIALSKVSPRRHSKEAYDYYISRTRGKFGGR